MLRSMLIITALSLSACSNTPGQAAIKMIKCESPRQQFCTMIYQPVCATSYSGLEKTYPSDCNACADENIAGFQQGECR